VIRGLDTLVRTLSVANRPLILTGAGLSVASGLPAYRQGADAVWDRFVLDWGTSQRFVRDPSAWWQRFWLKVHALTPATVVPNPGHLAIAQLATLKSGLIVVTQNIDGLHEITGIHRDQLVEVHGRHDRYHCIDPACPGFADQTERVDLLAIGRGVVPTCGLCGGLVRPTVLLFDEAYDSHPYYRSREAFGALAEADMLICVGTSYAVGVTDFALQHAARRGVPMFHLNVAPFASAADEAQRWAAGLIHDVVGPAETMLPAVVAQMRG
jgi:NAD-dependent deacetylase